MKRHGGWPATVLIIACCLGGGTLVPTLVVGWASGEPPSLLKAIDFAFGGGAPSSLDALGVIAAAAGGVILGGFAAIFLIRRSSPGSTVLSAGREIISTRSNVRRAATAFVSDICGA